MKGMVGRHLPFLVVFVVIAVLGTACAGKPAAPTLVRPENGASLPQVTEIILMWKPVSGATEYKVELWGGPYDKVMTPCNWQKGRTACAIGQMWPGHMFWHVNARNDAGRESGWSDTWEFTIEPFPPKPSDSMK